MNRQKITWLQILQGWSMLLVVIGHVTLTGIFENPQTPVSATIERVIYSFHMPLFMFISGFLFYFTKSAETQPIKKLCSISSNGWESPICSSPFHLRRQVYILTIHETPGRIVFTTIYRQFSISRLQPVERNVVRRHTLYHHAILSFAEIYDNGEFQNRGINYRKCRTQLIFPSRYILALPFQRGIYVPFFCLGILFCKFDIQRFLSHSGSLLLSLLLFIALNLIPDCPICC